MLKHCKSIVQKAFILIMAIMALNLQAVDTYYFYDHKGEVKNEVKLEKTKFNGKDVIKLTDPRFTGSPTIGLSSDGAAGMVSVPVDGNRFYMDRRHLELVPFLTRDLLSRLLEGLQSPSDNVLMPFINFSGGSFDLTGRALLRNTAVTQNNNDENAYIVTGDLTIVTMDVELDESVSVHVTISVRFNPGDGQIAGFVMRPSGQDGNTDIDFTVSYPAPEWPAHASEESSEAGNEPDSSLPAPEAEPQMPTALPTGLPLAGSMLWASFRSKQP